MAHSCICNRETSPQSLTFQVVSDISDGDITMSPMTLPISLLRSAVEARIQFDDLVQYSSMIGSINASRQKL